MTYREFPPPASLARIIECVWTRVPDAEGRSVPTQGGAHTILPDGAMDVIATFFPDGAIEEAFVVGAMTKPQLATVGNQHLVGIRFLPGAGATALGVNASALTDLHSDVRHLPAKLPRLHDAFRALRLDAANAHALHLFANSIGADYRTVPALVREAAKLLAGTSPPLRVGQVAQVLRVSRQHLARVFTAHAGISPKLFAQICRVRAMLAVAPLRLAGETRPEARHIRRLRGDAPESWSTLATEFGYADQSHLIAEVHALVGQTPAAWLERTGSNIPIVPVPVSAL